MSFPIFYSPLMTETDNHHSSKPMAFFRGRFYSPAVHQDGTVSLDGETYTSLTAAAMAVKRAHGQTGRVSGPAFFGLRDSYRCPGCGLAFSAFTPGITMTETHTWLRVGQDGPRTFRRAAVLGAMFQRKGQLWDEHVSMCHPPEPETDADPLPF